MEEAAEDLAAKRRLEALRLSAGFAAGAAAGTLQALLGGPLGLGAALAVMMGVFLGVDRYARRRPGYSLLRGLISYFSGFTLTWFSFYAAFIQ